MKPSETRDGSRDSESSQMFFSASSEAQPDHRRKAVMWQQSLRKMTLMFEQLSVLNLATGQMNNGALPHKELRPFMSRMFSRS